MAMEEIANPENFFAVEEGARQAGQELKRLERLAKKVREDAEFYKWTPAKLREEAKKAGLVIDPAAAADPNKETPLFDVVDEAIATVKERFRKAERIPKPGENVEEGQGAPGR